MDVYLGWCLRILEPQIAEIRKIRVPGLTDTGSIVGSRNIALVDVII